MPLEEIDSSSEGSGTDDDEMNEQESREAAFVVCSVTWLGGETQVSMLSCRVLL